MNGITLKCECGSRNITIVHGYFSYYLCEDCSKCYEEHTMKRLTEVKATFNIQGNEYTQVFTIDEIRSIREYKDLEKIIKSKL
ncbi:hypothetical protein [Dysgonomonas sp. ZJ279]|uniref:hypothetical protein n=1 Tax=Dysgonomonas sp. ZJ279 TaxID=2709796 RepID=UPI0013EB9A13|nr:hypothetical protein [Dysgonomonas sp. ZJ279]